MDVNEEVVVVVGVTTGSHYIIFLKVFNSG